jgi:tetratricopeptide (TPR) repeat protein
MCKLGVAAILLSGCGDNGPAVTDADQAYLDAVRFIKQGQNDKAMEALSASIAASPSVWALRERAKLYYEQGNLEAAKADCATALELMPDDPDMRWLQSEFAKPAGQRFQGKLKNPPSENR